MTKIKNQEKILNELKVHKDLYGYQIEEKTGLSLVTIVEGIVDLREKGYVISSKKAKEGGYFYRGYKKKRRTKKLSSSEKKWIIEKYKEGKSVNYILELVGISKTALYDVLKRNEVDVRAVHIEDYADQLKELYDKKYSLKEISEILSIPYGVIKSSYYKIISGDRVINSNRNEIKKDLYYLITNNKKIDVLELTVKYNISPSLLSRIKKEVISTIKVLDIESN